MGKSKQRRRYAVAVLLALAVAIALVAASSALALPSYETAGGGTAACVSCHPESGSATAPHDVAAHQDLFTNNQCTKCHNNGGVLNPPLPTACGACHGGLYHMVAEPTHSTQTCSTCHTGPTVSSITPGHGVGGTSVTIAGTGFALVQGAVAFGNGAATVTSWGDTSIVATVPAGLLAGPVGMTVTPNAGPTSAPFSFTIDTAGPTASKITHQARRAQRPGPSRSTRS